MDTGRRDTGFCNVVAVQAAMAAASHRAVHPSCSAATKPDADAVETSQSLLRPSSRRRKSRSCHRRRIVVSRSFLQQRSLHIVVHSILSWEPSVGTPQRSRPFEAVQVV